jgi:hypothetical protein
MKSNILLEIYTSICTNQCQHKHKIIWVHDIICNSADDECTVNELKTRKKAKRVKKEKKRRILIEQAISKIA